ncbi:sugar phosphate isomerase/epimerase family protein [Rothia uropygioeca]|uniref:sugar phosphate isomerase/epimerase family protein n=1 Tax=Kocuria sp. 257 TaxID=2021970 RepID=UPI00101394AE|nr:TIM barrel protein [Kocuria sp. 257]
MMTSHESSRRTLGLAALSSLTTPPDELIHLASDAGFDVVGIRVQKVTDAEPSYDLSPGSPLRRRLLTALSETGLRVLDTEFLLLDGSPNQQEVWERALDHAAGLTARTFTVAAADTEGNRLRDSLTGMVEYAGQRGLTVTVEPISYQAVNSLPGAACLARDTGAKILVDTLHLTRFGATLDELDAVYDVVGGIQLVDGPRAGPSDRHGLVTESRSDRLAPGHGEFPLRDYLAHLPTNLPVSVESCSDDYVRRHGPRQWLRFLHESTTAVLASTESPRV